MATNKPHQLDAEERNQMSDSTFAFPRVRKEPLNDAGHVRNAIARFDQVRDVSDAERDEAFRRIRKAADKFGVEMTETSWRQLGKPPKAKGPGAGKSAAKPRTGNQEGSKAELYAEARRRGIAGRSQMTKDELRHALRK